VLDEDALAACRAQAADRFGSVLRELLLKQCLQQTTGEPAGPARFAECVERDGGRLDIRHRVERLFQNGSSSTHGDAVMMALSSSNLCPLLLAALGEDAEVVAAGNVVAMSVEGWLQALDGSDDDDLVLADNMGSQAWHADGPHLFDTVATLPAHAFNVFFPLCDLTPQNGPTEFAIGSHERGREYCNSQEDASEEAAVPCRTILAHAGDAIIFDYRLWHRGSPNHSHADRQLLYAVVAKPWWLDSRNYRQGDSLFESTDDSARAQRLGLAALCLQNHHERCRTDHQRILANSRHAAQDEPSACAKPEMRAREPRRSKRSRR
jgi:ectoine hydroxylase-related dioxygenase (phytanoyl-CoA dioxygenase family)